MLSFKRFVGLVIRHLVLGAVVFGVNAAELDPDNRVYDYPNYVLSKDVAFKRTLPKVKENTVANYYYSSTRSADRDSLTDFYRDGSGNDRVASGRAGIAAIPKNVAGGSWGSPIRDDRTPPTLEGTPTKLGDNKGLGDATHIYRTNIQGGEAPTPFVVGDVTIKVVDFKLTTSNPTNKSFTVGAAITSIDFSGTSSNAGTVSYSFATPAAIPADTANSELSLTASPVAGLSLDSTTGILSGAPTAAVSGLKFRLAANDGADTILSDEFTITTNYVTDGGNIPSFSPATLGDQTKAVNTDVSITLPTATGGDGGLFYSLTTPANFPTGLTLTFTTNGVPTITGRAGITGSFPVTLKAVDSDDNMADSDAATLSFNLIITESLNAGSPIPDQFIIVGATSSAIDMTQYFNNPTNAGIRITVTGDDNIFTKAVSGTNVTLTGVGAGVDNAIVKVKDSADATIFVDLPMTVTVVVAATANAGSDQGGAGTTKIYKGDTVSLNGSGGGGNDASTYVWSQVGDNDVTFNDVNAAATTFIAPAGAKVLTLRLTVTNNGGTASDDVDITISNQAPVADAGGNKTIAEGASVILDGSGSDLEGDAITYAWTPPTGITLTGASTGSPTFTAPDNLSANEDFVFSLTVTAGGVVSAASNVTITVTGVNDKPIADAGSNRAVGEGVSVSLDGSGSSDSEGETLSYVWTPPTGITLSDATIVNPTWTAPSQLVNNRPIVFSLTVTTVAGVASVADTVTITVTAGANEPPTANAGVDQGANPIIAEGATVTLDGRGSSDPESEALSYAWTQTSGATVILDISNPERPTFTAPANLVSDEVLVFSLTVTAGGVASVAADTVRITVTGVNAKPTANAGADQGTNPIIAEGATVTLDGRGSSDPETASVDLSYAWTSPDGITLSDASIFNPTFTAPTQLASDNTLVFELEITDANGLKSDADTVRIIVSAGPNDPPEITISDPQTVNKGVNVRLTATAIDPERESMTYLWTQISGDNVDITGADTLSASFTAPDNITEDTELGFEFRATDLRGEFATATTVVTVMPGSDVDILHEQILTKLNQAVVAGAVDAVIDRSDAAFGGGQKLATWTLDGQTFTQGDTSGFNALWGKMKQYYDKIKNGKMNLKEMLSNTSFSMPINSFAGGSNSGKSTVWGRGNYKHLSGNKEVEWDGDLTSVQIGIDSKTKPDTLLGGMLSWADGKTDYTTIKGGKKDDKYNHSLISIHPYAVWKNQQITLWSVFGFGKGELEIIEGQQKSTTDTQLLSASAGVKGKLLPEIYLKGDVSLVKSKIKANGSNIEQDNVSSERFRLLVETKKTYQIASGSITPSAEAGVRYDTGDGATGVGGEFGAGFTYKNSENGVIITSKARTLLGQDGYKEWGIDGSIRYQQNSDGRGFSFNFEPSYGDTQSDKNSVFNSINNKNIGENDSLQNYASQIKTSLSYGISNFNKNAILKPSITLLTTPKNRHQTLALNYTTRKNFNLTLTTTATLNKPKNQKSNNLTLKSTFRF